MASQEKYAGASAEVTADDVLRLCEFIYRRTGMLFDGSKRYYIDRRLTERMVATQSKNFPEYFAHLRSDAEHEIEYLINAFTVNETYFYREDHQLRCMTSNLLDEIVLQKNPDQPIRIWSVPCSTGEEPYSIAMTLVEALGEHAARQCTVFASDIDSQVLAKAEAGVYSLDQVKALPVERLKRFFLKGTGSHAGLVKVRPELRAMVNFGRVNLTDARYDVKGPFDAIFCRNVMIYFDKPTQGQVLSRFEPLMKPGALLFAGHSENFTYVSQAFRLRGQTVYELSRDLKPTAKPQRALAGEAA